MSGQEGAVILGRLQTSRHEGSRMDRTVNHKTPADLHLSTPGNGNCKQQRDKINPAANKEPCQFKAAKGKSSASGGEAGSVWETISFTLDRKFLGLEAGSHT